MGDFRSQKTVQFKGSSSNQEGTASGDAAALRTARKISVASSNVLQWSNGNDPDMSGFQDQSLEEGNEDPENFRRHAQRFVPGPPKEVVQDRIQQWVGRRTNRIEMAETRKKINLFRTGRLCALVPGNCGRLHEESALTMQVSAPQSPGLNLLGGDKVLELPRLRNSVGFGQGGAGDIMDKFHAAESLQRPPNSRLSRTRRIYRPIGQQLSGRSVYDLF